MVRIALVADMHVFQTPTLDYNPLPDFKKVCEKLIELKPDIVIFAGDMFDYRHSISSFVRWFEGEGTMVSVRPLLEKLEARIYAIRGNHEKEEILTSIDQTVRNFEYKRDRSVEIAGVRLWLLDTRYERGSAEGKSAIENACTEARAAKGKKVLVIHENVGQMEDAIPDETIELASKTFDLVFNGHTHTWRRYPKTDNVYLLPSLLPSKLKMGAYWIERYSWEFNCDKYQVEKRESPYGFVLAEVGTAKAQFVPVEPSRRVIEVSVDVTKLDVREVERRFEEVLGEIEGAIVLPEIHGVITFPSVIVEQFLNAKGNWVGELANNARFAVPDREEVKLPQVPDVAEIIKGLVPKAVEENAPHLKVDVVQSALLALLSEGRLAEPRSSPKERLMDILSPMFERIKGKKPELFDKDLQEILSIAKKVRK